MKHPIIQKIEKAFETPGSFHPEQMREVVQEIAQHLQGLQKDLASSDAALREKASEQLSTLKAQLADKMMAIHAVQIPAKRLDAALLKSLTPKELETFNQVKPQLDADRKAFIRKRRRLDRDQWIAS